MGHVMRTRDGRVQPGTGHARVQSARAGKMTADANSPARRYSHCTVAREYRRTEEIENPDDVTHFKSLKTISDATSSYFTRVLFVRDISDEDVSDTEYKSCDTKAKSIHRG